MVLKICFTGHRPNNPIMGGYNFHSDKNKMIQEEIFKKVTEVIRVKSMSEDIEAILFFYGGAIGFDQLAFDVLQKQFSGVENIYHIIAVPFENQPAKWLIYDRERYQKQLELADKIVYVDRDTSYAKVTGVGEYRSYKLHDRNKFMVKSTQIVIACYDGHSSGGTASCIKYAMEHNKEIHYLGGWF